MIKQSEIEHDPIQPILFWINPGSLTWINSVLFCIDY
jgi:hypothetical protein